MLLIYPNHPSIAPRYVPSACSLALQELDEKDLGTIQFHTKDSVIKVSNHGNHVEWASNNGNHLFLLNYISDVDSTRDNQSSTSPKDTACPTKQPLYRSGPQSTVLPSRINVSYHGYHIAVSYHGYHDTFPCCRVALSYHGYHASSIAMTTISPC